jgi:hypothetical protein
MVFEINGALVAIKCSEPEIGGATWSPSGNHDLSFETRFI